jgi:hypothetical protein
MKTMNKLALGLTALFIAGMAHAQTTPFLSGSDMSVRDNPGILGHTYLDVNYNWVDFTEDQVDADAYIAAIRGNAPVAPGLDAGFGYAYYRENGNGNIFNNSPFDVRAHQLAADATFYGQGSGIKPFLSGAIGYQWSRGDIQNLSIDDGDWLWGASAGAEIPFGTFAVTPRISYSDTIGGSDEGQWSYGGELHHWFSEGIGGYLDATFHDPRHSLSAEYWTYTAGVRFRF